MRRRLIWTLLLLAPLVFLGSCSKDNDPAPPAIAGTWVRIDYTITAPPTGYTKYWTNYKFYSYNETGYTIKFNADGTYSRSYSPDINDKGKWTLEGNKLTLKPTDPNDEDSIKDEGFVGLEFDVVGDISDARLTLSRVITLGLALDSKIDAVGGFSNLGKLTSSDFQAANCTVQFKFNKLN